MELAGKTLPMTPWTPALHGLCELPSNNPAETQNGPQVVLIYEDLEMGLRSVKLLGTITKAACIDDTGLSTWRFDHLQSADIRRKASARAQSADIVMVALRSGHGFPSHVRSWFDEWIRSRKAHEGALVAVFEPDDSMEFRPSGTASLLQAVAITAGMDYFSNAPKQTNRFAPYDDAPDWMMETPPTPRWGLNE
jgi:hypothetical protein